ncbi:hypothetical protein OG21DRAFT_1447577 [Imleria badia]|nr:hypothetical protein OG21DRAFT_1447577 [Imleria badia]
MSATEPTASSTIQALAQELPFIKFPPFPEPPPGVTIMSFKDFKPRGIQLFSEPKKGGPGAEDDEDAELDALGIPTVELRVKHTTDECKSNTRKKRKKKKAAVVEPVPAKMLPWYEEWEEGEDLRVTRVRYDPNLSPVDRFFQSAYDFRTGRPWPAISSGLNNLWDQFRLFTGLLVNPSVFRKAGAKKSVRAESPDFESDDEDDPAMNIKDDATAGDSRPTKRQRSGEAPDPDDESDPHKLDEEVREEKISIFLSDPEKAVRIFLSSYMHEHGLIWYVHFSSIVCYDCLISTFTFFIGSRVERNLIYTPRLVAFFLAFVLRNGVLPEPVYRRGLKKALDMIEWATKELPLTLKVGQSLPDSFNEACRECFGRQGGMNWSVVNGTSTTTEEKDAGIAVTNVSNGVKTNVALPTEAQIQLKQVIEDNVDMEVSVNTPATVVSPINENASNDNSTGLGNGWGNNTWADEGTANAWAQNISWGDEPQETTGETVADTKWGGSDPSWNRDLKSLSSLLGPSAFPLTHTTGIVECSTRRISAIQFPPNHPKGVPSASQKNLGRAKVEAGGRQEWTPSADGVEAELDARFAKVILEPWGREEGDISGPEIWNTSRGPVIDPNKPSKVPTGAATRRPHDPLKDNITLLAEPSFAEMLELVPGLGLAAMWIEIVRQKSGVGVDAAGAVAQVDSNTPRRFWYHEDVTGIFPSFYTPREKE